MEKKSHQKELAQAKWFLPLGILILILGCLASGVRYIDIYSPIVIAIGVIGIIIGCVQYTRWAGLSLVLGSIAQYLFGLIGWAIITMVVNFVFYDSEKFYTYFVIIITYTIGVTLAILFFRGNKLWISVGIYCAIALFLIAPILVIFSSFANGKAILVNENFLTSGYCIPPLFYFPFPLSFFSAC